MSEGYLERIVPHEMWCARYGPYPQHTGKPCNCPVKIVRELEAENRRLKASVETVTCPFCQESDFDLEGLDNHLYRYCEKYGGMHAQAGRVDRLEAENQRLKAEVQRLEVCECGHGYAAHHGHAYPGGGIEPEHCAVACLTQCRQYRPRRFAELEAENQRLRQELQAEKSK